MSRTAIAIIAAIAGVSGAVSTWAGTPLSVRDSWRIGNSGTSFCSAQSLTVDKALTGMFDAGYSITCRDAALPVGKLYKLRSSSDAEARLAADRAERATCTAPRRSQVSGLGDLDVIDCKLQRRRRRLSCLRAEARWPDLRLRGPRRVRQRIAARPQSLVADQPINGEISIATTGLGDPAAFARVQAGTLAPDKALEEAYRRNNAGSYAEAAEFFAAASSARPMHRSAAPRRWSTRRSRSRTSAASPRRTLVRTAAEHCRQRSDRRPPAAQLSRHSRPQPGRRQGRAGRARQAAAPRRRQHARMLRPGSSRSTLACQAPQRRFQDRASSSTSQWR